MLDEHQVAAVLGQSVRTLRNHRLNNTGPRFIKLNGCTVRYRIGDLQVFIESQPAGGGATAGSQPRRGPGRQRKDSRAAQ